MKLTLSSLFLSSLSISLLGKGALAYKQVHRPNEKETTSEEAKPWLRTVYDTQVEIVTPTVIAGVTFSGKPLPTPDPLEPWVSLKKDGTPQTIKPEVKNGRTKKGRPNYSTYFKTATVVTYSYEQLKAHNMDPNDVYEEEVYLDEDDTYVSLNPVIRCTPERYFFKGLAKDISSEPFCTPRENSQWKVGKTYFVSWFTQFFDDEHSGTVIDKVRVHLSYVKEKASDKGYHKRDIPATFFSSEWVKNVDGMYPIEVDEDWLQGQYERRIVVSVQPFNVPDDEFNPLERGVLLYMILGSKVAKTTKEEWAMIDAGISDDKWYYVALTIPTLVVVVCVAIYFFLHFNGRYRDFSDVTQRALASRHRIIGKVSEMKKFRKMKNHRYDELPSYNKRKTK
ncbi:Psg1p NDAI_0C00450 [Naumovozyma dairenensis CBS 421]|uniref:Uncharacterized protein n=1 Tax=Naumovozyma dairenensis (strain ATCC 10597 / BCRC 20456 / CBS 421 / NBRC 0211 / NRRL Y-12639) TaxID=1071378 RepID=G0W7E5_NAUDC|nr:hypothetical protein NDAI_0C00450 [Naumovozyma dairenensis CBS 421]CCD23706.1 hypothetical protein NDAI_0C00450 [Naumovozyma dairenensis CBS 421]